jgi:tetratricopeptide (TPR) repeat protein
MTDRLGTLRSLVSQNPADSRMRYMLAAELRNAGEHEAALGEYRDILARDADYVAAYYQGGRTLEELDRPEEARTLYEQGVEACRRTGDAHTQSELQEVLAALP